MRTEKAASLGIRRLGQFEFNLELKPELTGRAEYRLMGQYRSVGFHNFAGEAGVDLDVRATKAITWEVAVDLHTTLVSTI